MTQGQACYQDVDEVLDLSYVPKISEDNEVDDILDLSYVPNTAEDIVLTQAQTACYHQDVDEFLHLSYVPNTAEDTVLFKEKQKYMYLWEYPLLWSNYGDCDNLSV